MCTKHLKVHGSIPNRFNFDSNTDLLVGPLTADWLIHRVIEWVTDSKNKCVKGVSFWRNCGAVLVGEYNKVIWFY